MVHRAASAIFLPSVKPVRNETPTPVYRMAVSHDKYPDGERDFSEAEISDPVRRSAYLVTIGHCMECHSPAADGRTLYERALGRGGKQYSPKMVKGFPPGWPGSVARNIGSDASAGIGGWTDLDIKRAITQGISRDGRPARPCSPSSRCASARASGASGKAKSGSAASNPSSSPSRR